MVFNVKIVSMQSIIVIIILNLYWVKRFLAVQLKIVIFNSINQKERETAPNYHALLEHLQMNSISKANVSL